MLVEVAANDSCGAEAAQISHSSEEEIVAITDDETESESCATECRNNPTEEEEIALTSIVLPPVMKNRGRPKGSKQAVVGFPKKRKRNENRNVTAFSLKPAKEVDEIILKWFVQMTLPVKQ